MSAPLLRIVEEHALGHPSEPAVITVSDRGALSWSWSELWEKSGQIASLLLELDVHPAEAVAYQLPNCPEFVAISLGILRVGAVCCPLMPVFRERELSFALERSAARVLFIRDTYRTRRPIDEIAAVAPRLNALSHLIVLGDADRDLALPRSGRLASSWLAPRLARVRVDAAAVAARAPRSEDLAQLLFTSGTSGTPKGVLHRHETLSRAVELSSAHLGLSRRDRIFIPSPLAHQTGFLYGMWQALALRATQILQESWAPRPALAALREWRGTFVQAATPFLVDLLERVEAGEPPPDALRIFVATGAAVPRSVAHRATRLLRTAVCGAFGTTEGCLATLSSPQDDPVNAWNTDGHALPSVRIRVCDDQGEPLPPGREGHFQTHSPTMFQGYLNDTEATNRAYTPDGWYKTGDLAVIDADGFLHITGRVKDVINRGGEKIPVSDIEQLLHEHESVREAAVVSMPDPRLGERACAFIVLQPNHRLDFEAMTAYLDQRKLAKPYWPERLELIAELPKTASGKVQKYVLRERARGLSPEPRES